MTKIFKNPARETRETVKPYVPQYKLRGLEPEQIPSAFIASEASKKAFLTKHAPVISYDNPRTRPPPTISVNVPYAETVDTFLSKDQTLPNVGNNMETTWAGVDEMVVDDLGINQNIDPNAPMIDNNENDPSNYSDIPNTIQKPRALQIEDGQVENHDYMLIVNKEIISTGSLEQIQDEVRSLVIEHDIPIEAIIVFKQMKIKMGIFIE